MRVVLLQDVKSLGQKGAIKNVSPGYARNFLIPQGLARQVSKGEIQEVESQVETRKQQDQELENILKIFEKETSKDPIQVNIETGKRGEIFASLKEEDLLFAVSRHPSLRGLQIKVSTEKPIKKLGSHRASINLGRGVKGEFSFELKPNS